MIWIPQCFQTISVQILEFYSELCIKIAVFKNLFILKGRKSLLLFAKCYSWIFFFISQFLKTQFMSSKCDSKYYLYICFHISEYYKKDTFLFSWVFIVTQGLITQSWNKAVPTPLFPNQGIETHWYLENKHRGKVLNFRGLPLWVLRNEGKRWSGEGG